MKEQRFLFCLKVEPASKFLWYFNLDKGILFFCLLFISINASDIWNTDPNHLFDLVFYLIKIFLYLIIVIGLLNKSSLLLRLGYVVYCFKYFLNLIFILFILIKIEHIDLEKNFRVNRRTILLNTLQATSVTFMKDLFYVLMLILIVIYCIFDGYILYLIHSHIILTEEKPLSLPTFEDEDNKLIN